MNAKSEKELAFLQDLYVATDWGERFAELVDEHVELPEEGRALYVGAGTGGHAMALQERASEKLEFICVDESEECLELARAKAQAMNKPAQFQPEDPAALSFVDEEFDLVLGNGSMLAPDRRTKMISELARVAAPGGKVMCWLTTASSFGEFFSIYWEALHNAGLADHGSGVETRIQELPTVTDVEALAMQAGLEDVTSCTRIEEFDYDSGEEFLNSPLITDFLLRGWLQSLPERAQPRVSQEIARLIDEERHGAEFAIRVKATVVMGKKRRAQ